MWAVSRSMPELSFPTTHPRNPHGRTLTISDPTAKNVILGKSPRTGLLIYVSSCPRFQPTKEAPRYPRPFENVSGAPFLHIASNINVSAVHSNKQKAENNKINLSRSLLARVNPPPHAWLCETRSLCDLSHYMNCGILTVLVYSRKKKNSAFSQKGICVQTCHQNTTFQTN